MGAEKLTRRESKKGACKNLSVLVELVGIEPTTSSLRILNPVRDGETPKKSE